MKDALKGLGIGLLIVLVAVAIWWFAYGAKVASSGVIGQGDAIIQKNSAENWVAAQAKFEDLYADIESQGQAIDLLKETAEADPSAFNKRNYDGARLVCMEAVGDYNAEADKFLSEEFRSTDLPYQIDASMYCKE